MYTADVVVAGGLHSLLHPLYIWICLLLLYVAAVRIDTLWGNWVHLPGKERMFVHTYVVQCVSMPAAQFAVAR